MALCRGKGNEKLMYSGTDKLGGKLRKKVEEMHNSNFLAERMCNT